MALTFHIEHLSPEKLIISAQGAKTLPNVKEYLSGLGIMEEKDYCPSNPLLDDPSTCLTFPTAAAVLKALYRIPFEKIDPKSVATYTQEYGLKSGTNAEKYQQIKQRYATLISKEDCANDNDVETFIAEASQDLFNFIRDGVKSIQVKYKKSEGIQDLLNELEQIDHAQGDLFKSPKYILAFCCLYFAYIEKVSPLRKKEKPSDIAPKLYKLCKEALHRMPFVAPWNDYKFYETHITYTKPLENPIPALAPPTPSPSTPLSAVISSQRLEEAKRGELMCKELFQKLIDRKFAVEKRVQKNYFWQNSQKNNAKLAALQAIETACTTGKETTEILKLIKEKHAILTQSTSALPLFFPKPVTTKTILAPYQSIIQTP